MTPNTSELRSTVQRDASASVPYECQASSSRTGASASVSHAGTRPPPVKLYPSRNRNWSGEYPNSSEIPVPSSSAPGSTRTATAHAHQRTSPTLVSRRQTSARSTASGHTIANATAIGAHSPARASSATSTG